MYSDRVKSARGLDINAVRFTKKDSRVNDKQTVFLIIKGVNIISYAYKAAYPTPKKKTVVITHLHE